MTGHTHVLSKYSRSYRLSNIHFHQEVFLRACGSSLQSCAGKKFFRLFLSFSAHDFSRSFQNHAWLYIFWKFIACLIIKVAIVTQFDAIWGISGRLKIFILSKNAFFVVLGVHGFHDPDVKFSALFSFSAHNFSRSFQNHAWSYIFWKFITCLIIKVATLTQLSAIWRISGRLQIFVLAKKCFRSGRKHN